MRSSRMRALARHCAPLWLGLLLAVGAPAVQAQEASLETLHAEIARDPFNLDLNLRLVRYLKDHDQAILAFYIAENWRRGPGVDEKQFDAAFRRWVTGEEPFDDSTEGEARAKQAVQRVPNDAARSMKLADIYISRSDWKNARPLVERALALQPANFEYVQVLAELDKRDTGKDPESTYAEFAARNPETPEAYSLRLKLLTSKPPVDAAAVRAFVEDAHRRFPRYADFTLMLARLAQSEKRDDEATRLYEEAGNASLDNGKMQGMIGRYFLRVPGGEARALRFYLNAYFSDPHFYDTEYAEARINRLLVQQLKDLEKGWADGTRNLENMLTDKNPEIANIGITISYRSWKSEYADLLTPLIASDSNKVSRAAAGVISQRADRSYDPTLKRLLAGPDAQVRSLSAFIALRLWGADGLAVVQPFLDDPRPLVQYNTAGAIFREGGPAGCAVLDSYRKKQVHPRIRAFLEEERVVGKCGWK